MYEKKGDSVSSLSDPNHFLNDTPFQINAIENFSNENYKVEMFSLLSKYIYNIFKFIYFQKQWIKQH